MKTAYRVSPVILGTDIFTSVVYGDQSSVLVTENWPFDTPHIPVYETPDCRMYATSPFLVAKSLFDVLHEQNVAHLEVCSHNDQYLITFDDEKNE